MTRLPGWLGLVVVCGAALAVYLVAERRWDRWEPGDFSLELCVVQDFGSPDPSDGPGVRAEREALCVERLRLRHREARRGPLVAGLGLLVLGYVVVVVRREWGNSEAGDAD